MRRRCLAAAALLALAATAACGGASSQPTPTAGPSATAATEPPSAGPMIVYSKYGGEPPSPSESTVVAYDLSLGRQISSFDASARQAVLGDRRVIVNLTDSIVSYAIDGSDPRELRHAPEGGHIIGIGLSPDKTKLALTEERPGMCGTPDAATGIGMCRPYADVTSIFVIDASDGHELMTVPQSDPRFDGYRGQAAQITWRDDGRGFVVEAYTYSEYYGGLATVMLDGSVTTHSFRGWPHLAPNGRYIAEGQFEVCDLSSAIEQHELILRDLDSGRTLATISDPVQSFSLYEWSPDSSAFLYASHVLKPKPAGAPCKMEDEATAAWHTLRTDGSPPAGEPDPCSVRRRWYGERVIEYRCNGEPALTSWCVSESPSPPPGGYVPVDIYVNDQLIGSGMQIQLLGFLTR